MQIPHHLKSRLSFISRTFMWAIIGLLVVIGFSKSAPAWGAPTACPGESTIPVTPVTLFLRYAGPAATYQVSLCEDPTAPVNVTTAVSQAGKIALNPANFALTSTVSQTVSVAVANGHPSTEPFTVVITHSATSDDPDFDYGTLNIPTVTAYYSPPLAVDDAVATLHGQSIDINVLANDIDRLGQGLSLIADPIIDDPAHGSATRNANSTIRYTPQPGFSGADSFTYQVNDAIGNTDTATVVVIVAPQSVLAPSVQRMTAAGGEMIFPTSAGNVAVVMPKINGVPADSTIYCLFGLVGTSSGDTDNPPVPSLYSGMGFYFQCYINGEALDDDALDDAIALQVPLSDVFIQNLGSARLIVAAVAGEDWSLSGIQTDENPINGNLSVSVSRQGEFALFIQRMLLLPFLERQ